MNWKEYQIDFTKRKFEYVEFKKFQLQKYLFKTFMSQHFR